MRRPPIFWLIALLAAFAIACGGDDGTPADNDTDQGEDVDGGDDAGDDTGDGDDVEEEVPFLPGEACTYQDDCSSDEVCLDGHCYPQISCRNEGRWGDCIEAYTEVDPVLGERAVCLEKRCDVLCWNDVDCPDGQSCTDWGYCREYTGTLEPYAITRGDRKPLEAGFGTALQYYPVGLPLGGYGSRGTGPMPRFGISLRDSYGTSHALTTHAMALDTGENKLMLVRVPLIFTGGDIHEQVAQNLQAETGYDWRDGLIISSTHTHSGPGRHWPLPTSANIPIGSLGIGEYSQQARDWVVQTITEAALAAIDNMAPSRFGWEIVESFDTDNAIASDRWSETPQFDDNRILIMRVDDMDGAPRGVLLSFGMHGTINSSDYATHDASFSVENVIESRLSELHDRNVPVMFVNQNGGSMSPRGGNQSYPFSLQRIGHILWDRISDAIDGIETSSDISLRASSYRFPINYDLLGYRDEPELWRNTSSGFPLGGPYVTGAITCAIPTPVAPEYKRSFAQSCMSMRFLIHNRAPTMFQHSMMNAVELDGLSILTAPGELTMELGWDMVRALRDEFDIDPMKAWTWGYSNAHHLYLPPTDLDINGDRPPYPGLSTPEGVEFPPYSFSYWSGGYEANMNLWGWRIGDYLVARGVDAWNRMLGNDVRIPEQYPLVFSRVDEEPWDMDATPEDLIGNIIDDVPETVARYQQVEFAWVGGDSQAEMPQAPTVTLQRLNGDDWEEIILPNKRAYSNYDFHFLTRMRDIDGVWEWIAKWEEMHDFPLGTYRFKVDGHYFKVANDPSSRTPYTTTSSAFELVPTEIRVVEASADGAELTADLTYDIIEGLQFINFENRDIPTDNGAVSGNFRLRDLRVGIGQGRPVDPVVDGEGDLSPDSVLFVPADGGDAIELESVTIVSAQNGDDPVGRLTVVLPEEALEMEGHIEFTDEFGNFGSFAFPLE